MHGLRFEYEYDLGGAVTVIGRVEDDDGVTWIARAGVAADSEAGRQLARQAVVGLLQQATG